MLFRSRSFLRVCDSSATWLFRRSSTAIRRSLSAVRLWFRPVFFASFFQIDIFESCPAVFLPSGDVLDHKASPCVPSVLVVSSIRLLCFRSTHVEVGFVRESIDFSAILLPSFHNMNTFDHVFNNASCTGPSGISSSNCLRVFNSRCSVSSVV